MKKQTEKPRTLDRSQPADEEMIDVLLAISIVSKRLARRLVKMNRWFEELENDYESE